MPPLNRALLLAPLLFAIPDAAHAQNFFEELFGIGRAAKPPVPPRGVPGGPVPGAPVAPPPGEAPPAVEAPRAPPPPKQPVVLKAPSEDNVMGQELLRNGLDGNLKLEKTGGTVTARLTLPGTKVSSPAESCTVPWNDGAPATLTAEGRPDGLARFDGAGAACPLRFEVVEGGVFVTSLSGSPVCTVAALDCAAAPTGLWGPAAATLIPRSAEFDTARGTADRAVRENYKLMTQRAKGQDVRPIVTEQAAFSSDREQTCRTYAREGAHGFCNLRFTEGRALALATRLGVNTATAAPTASAAPRPRRKPQAPAVEGMNPDAGGAPGFPE
ncbi:hypothetical protein [Methylobacterium gossipiicola]|uniref:Uncharacterized protein n=1 Tax=Methylobacterium gossipiicola TaxID=582675 RepID=A0A1I2QIB8_9HYPH|nr:hypothetical protein [Methylobacterium gossipiicola]SFG28134.1 hypothetical protein SAMN05192565_101165 [Methylobacterium gossipiicola]